MTIAKQLLKFYQKIQSYPFDLPKDIKALQLYEGEVLNIITDFFKKYYNDNHSRTLILGINPGRKGAAITGIPFTDSDRLFKIMDKTYPINHSYEPSADFFHTVVNGYGGAKKFYKSFLISSVSPIGFIVKNQRDNWVNFNYYDRKELEELCSKFIKEMMEEQLKMNIKRDTAICLGKGKNYKRLQILNEQNKWFERIVPIEHPRYIIQYKRKYKSKYVEKYLELLKKISE